MTKQFVFLIAFAVINERHVDFISSKITQMGGPVGQTWTSGCQKVMFTPRLLHKEAQKGNPLINIALKSLYITVYVHA